MASIERLIFPTALYSQGRRQIKKSKHFEHSGLASKITPSCKRPLVALSLSAC